MHGQTKIKFRTDGFNGYVEGKSKISK